MKLKRYLRSFQEEFRQRLEENPKRARFMSFLGKMLVFGIAFQSILYWNPDTSIIQQFFARITGELLVVLGMDYSYSGISVVGREGIYLITRDCLGWKSIALASALIISTSEIREKAKYVILGMFLVFIANIIRVLTTIILAEQGIVSFEIIHTFLWRWGLAALVLGFWIYSMRAD